MVVAMYYCIFYTARHLPYSAYHMHHLFGCALTRNLVVLYGLNGTFYFSYSF